MRTRLSRPATLLGTLCAIGACSGSGGNAAGSGGAAGLGGTGGTGGGGNPATAPYATLTWQVSTVEAAMDRPSGIQGKLLVDAAGTLYYGYYRKLDPAPNCDIAVFSDAHGLSTNYELHLAIQGTGQSSWRIETAPLIEVAGASHNYVNSLLGLDAVLNAAGDPVLAFAGGGSGRATCGSSDLVLATFVDGATPWQFAVPAADSIACCTGNRADGAPECPDPACTLGTDVGAWATVALDGGGNLAAAYADYHFYWDYDAQNFHDYEMYHQADGIFGIRPWSGLGRYGDLLYIGDVALVAFGSFKTNGLTLLRRTGSAASTQDWEVGLVRPLATPGERISLAATAAGRLGLAYHDTLDNGLIYCESADGGVTWPTQPCTAAGDIDPRPGGAYASLAFDGEGRPLIAYRVCGFSTSGGCDNQYDGAGLAWRELDGSWSHTAIHDNNLTKSGLYTSLVIDPLSGAPVVAFHDQTAGAAMIARGVP